MAPAPRVRKAASVAPDTATAVRRKRSPPGVNQRKIAAHRKKLARAQKSLITNWQAFGMQMPRFSDRRSAAVRRAQQIVREASAYSDKDIDFVGRLLASAEVSALIRMLEQLQSLLSRVKADVDALQLLLVPDSPAGRADDAAKL